MAEEKINDIGTLRNHLFASIERISVSEDSALTDEIHKANAIIDITDAILRTVQTEQEVAIQFDHGGLKTEFCG